LASTDFFAVIKVDPQNWVAYQKLGTIGRAEENYDFSLTMFIQALTYNPLNVGLLIQAAELHQAQEQYEEALVYYSRALTINPDSVLAKCGEFYSLQGIELNRLKQILSAAPNDVNARIGCAKIYLKRGFFDLALEGAFLTWRLSNYKKLKRSKVVILFY